MYFNVKLLLYKTKEQWKVSDGLCTFLFRDGGGEKMEVTNTYLQQPAIQFYRCFMCVCKGKPLLNRSFQYRNTT